jgi:hypothetical protein
MCPVKVVFVFSLGVILNCGILSFPFPKEYKEKPMPFLPILRGGKKKRFTGFYTKGV